MNDKIKRFTFYNIFFLCAFCSLFMVLEMRSFASDRVNITTVSVNYEGISKTEVGVTFTNDDRQRLFAILNKSTGNSTNPYEYVLYSNKSDNLPFIQTTYGIDWNTGATLYQNVSNLTMTFTSHNGVYRGTNFVYKFSASSNLYIFDNLEDLEVYLTTGVVPQLPFDDSLELDSLKVKSWQLGTSQGIFKSSFEVTWSNPNISFVQVIIEGVSRKDSFESYSSPFKQKFSPGQYVMKKGDVVHITATPYKSDGSYGVSLYQSFEYDDNIPGSNIYRKFTNTPYSDNTLTIPYTGVSGQPQSVTLPVDGITTNNTYKVNYNPVTYEYGDLNLYEIYYSPVVIYPSGATDEEIDETQDVINNTYTTNNYYETTKNINMDFDVSFGDISGSDIQHGFDDFGNFSNGFGGFISKLSSWVLALFPFLSPIVASAIVIMFGLIALLAIIALVLKIASVIADLIPF